jgi:hypothetical protein
MLGAIGFLALVVLPGAWITFGLPLKGMPFWVRLAAGAAIAPFVVAVQFYIVRLSGISFEASTLLLIVLNLPPLYLMARRWPGWPQVDRRSMALAIMVGIIIIASIAPFLLDPQKRIYTWEAWSQADVVYSLANGGLDLEDADLAGVRLSYPWAGEVYQAVTSYVIGGAPAANFIWANLVWLLIIFAFAAGIVAELGGNQLSQVTVAIWLSFGVNVVGSLGANAIPASWVQAHPSLGDIWGDPRYTPWLDKLLFFGQMYFAMALFAAILYLMIRGSPANFGRSYVLLTGLLLGALGVIYPILLPAAAAVVGARWLVTAGKRLRTTTNMLATEVLGLPAILLVALIVTLVQVKFLTEGRSSTTLVSLNTFHDIRLTGVETFVVMSPLIIAFAIWLARNWRTRPGAASVLGIGALASCGLFVVFDVPWFRNEYKFIFTAAICLAPFPSLLMEPLLERLGRLAVAGVVVLAAILAVPFALGIQSNSPSHLYTELGPVTDADQFDLRLVTGRMARLTDAIRTDTPIDSLLVVDNADLHLPTLTQRHMFVAPATAQPYPGVLVTSDDMLTLVKGYPQSLVDERRAVVRALLDSDQSAQRWPALQQILALNRPLALIIDEQHQAGVIGWLVEQGIGKPVYTDEGMDVWLIEPGEPAVAQSRHL